MQSLLASGNVTPSIQHVINKIFHPQMLLYSIPKIIGAIQV
jgi:hypothetical protein